MRQFPDRNGPDLDVDDVFSHAAFSALKASGAAFAVVRPEGCDVLWANASAARFFDAASPRVLATILFGADGHSAGWLDGLTQGVVPGRPPRLARGGFSRGFGMRAHTVLIRALATPQGDELLAFAVPEAAGSEDVIWRQQAWLDATRPTGVDAECAPEQSAESAGSGIDDGAADQGLTLARRSQIAVLRDRLTHALDGSTTLRLLWWTDVADRVTRIDAEAVARLGARVSFLDGSAFPDAVAAFDLSGGEQLRAALTSRATWSGLTLDLPVSDGLAHVPMVLSGAPVFGPGRLFAGFRGFGTVDLGQLDLASPRRADAAAPAQAPIADEPASQALTPAAHSIEDPRPRIDDDEIPSEPSAASVESPNVSPPSPANVVHLRAFQALALGRFGGLGTNAVTAPVAPFARVPAEAPADGGLVEDAPDPQPAASPPGVDLAFLALGDALRARIGGLRGIGEPEQAPLAPEPEAIGSPTTGSEAAAAGCDQRLSTHPADAEGSGKDVSDKGVSETDVLDRDVLDRDVLDSTDDVSHGEVSKDAASHGDVPVMAQPVLEGQALLREIPLPLLVTVGSSPVFGNPGAAALLGYDPTADLERAGLDIQALVDTGRLTSRDAEGRATTVAARRSDVAWNGRAAVLWILEGAAPEPARDEPQPSSTPVGDEMVTGAGELLDRVDDAVALLDGNGLVRRLNSRGESWFENAIGRSFTQILTSDSRPSALALLGDVRGQTEGLGTPPLRQDVQARLENGAVVPMVLTLGRLGEAGFYLTLRDVSALKRAETERAGAERDQVRDADRLPALLGRVSHEIRTPLNAILGFAEIMMDERFGPLGNPRYKDYLKDIHTSGTQVMTMVEDLLDLSRIEAGQLEMTVEVLDVNRIVSETVAQMQPEAHRGRVIMRTSLGGRIPAVLADERSARQIVRNLLSNAVKFNEPGGQVIVSTALSDGGTVLLRVRDTGVGMTDEEIAAALEPFGGGLPSQAANGNGSGNGLGLPLTRALVGVNGASMAISSRPREGTLVEVAFVSAGTASERRPA